jgi:hypothetical protein
MFQRKANMKPAALQDGCNVSLRSLIAFIESCETTLKSKGHEDEAFRFECIAEYLRKDFSPSKGLTFKSGVLGL